MTRDDMYNTIPPIRYNVTWDGSCVAGDPTYGLHECLFENYRAALAFARLRVVEGYKNVDIEIDTYDHMLYLGRMITQPIDP